MGWVLSLTQNYEDGHDGVSVLVPGMRKSLRLALERLPECFWCQLPCNIMSPGGARPAKVVERRGDAGMQS